VLCKEIMKTEVQCIMADDTIQTAARKMRDANVGFLPVCDSSWRVLGTLTDRDLAIRVLAENRPLSTSARDVMTHEVVACRPDDDVMRAEQLMGQHHKSRVLCTEEDGRLVGVISLSDIAQREDDRNTAQTMRRVTERETTAHNAGAH
jgi:CBS domain-containing protein